ncbi:serine threonine-protein phosphatase 4 regulatory subunit 4-like isoform x4 protein [Lasius niger]|uniref:Serine threonine-protein phosphatase 4 regulatory subunit 4-like isoform x4 protein n=1 Tax=Lasius niger TaxID=67767 RepID=A0A0J7K631_LASNI|nr:serine threonine-protein phosphatase 4 regulatory subunit 4-like isoform x4 protein [Lasius niger]
MVLQEDYGAAPSRQTVESLKTRILLTHPWERVGYLDSHTNTSHLNFENGSSNDYIAQNLQCSCSKLAVFQALLQLPDTCEQEYKSSDASQCGSYYDTDSDHAKFRKQSIQASEYNNSSALASSKPFFLSLVRDDNTQESQQHSLLTGRDYSREFPTNIGDKDRTPNFAGLRALTDAAHYNSCWAFSSMPEIPVMQSDDEFLVDAGIRIPAQFSASSTSASKIPHLQDFIATRRPNNSTVRPRRNSVNFDKAKFKRHSSVEYEDCMKRRTSENDDPSIRSTPTSIDYEEGLRQRNMLKENLSDQQSSKTKRYSAPYGKTRFGWDASQERSLDEKFKRNSLILDKEKLRFASSKCVLDRTKRHSTNFSLRLPDSKETKQNVKRHSLEDHTTVRRTIKGYFSTLDVNHNQGLSKIPLRNVGSRSRTAPATRASSPVHVESRLRFDIENCDDIRSSSTSDRHLSRFSSSDEEVDKLCRMLLHSQTENVMAQSSASGTPRSRGSITNIQRCRK